MIKANFYHSLLLKHTKFHFRIIFYAAVLSKSGFNGFQTLLIIHSLEKLMLQLFLGQLIIINIYHITFLLVLLHSIPGSSMGHNCWGDYRIKIKGPPSKHACHTTEISHQGHSSMLTHASYSLIRIILGQVGHQESL